MTLKFFPVCSIGISGVLKSIDRKWAVLYRDGSLILELEYLPGVKLSHMAKGYDYQPKKSRRGGGDVYTTGNTIIYNIYGNPNYSKLNIQSKISYLCHIAIAGHNRAPDEVGKSS